MALTQAEFPHSPQLKTLLSAVERGNVEVARQVLSDEPELALITTSAARMTWLHKVMSFGSCSPTAEMVEMLIQAGTPIAAVDHFGRTPLMDAISGNHLSVAQILIAAGAFELELERNNGPDSWTLIHEAARTGVALEDLCRRGADVNRVGREGTPLMIVARKKHGAIERAQLLLQAGADPTIEVDGKTAIDVARRAKRKDFVELFKAHAAAMTAQRSIQDVGPAAAGIRAL